MYENKIKFIFLNKQIILDKKSIFSKIGTGCDISDFAILIKNREYFDSIFWQIKNDSNYSLINLKHFYEPNSSIKNVGIRPTFIHNILIDNNLIVSKMNNSVRKIEFGEYPQTVVNLEFSGELEKHFKDRFIRKTGKLYNVYYMNQITDFYEYEYNGNKYVRVLESDNIGKLLSDGRRTKRNEIYWIKVEPIVWLIDNKYCLYISDKVLFHIPHNIGYNIIDSQDFLDTFFANNIIPSKLDYFYLVNFKNPNGTISPYYGAYEENGILKEINTNIMLVPEDANYVPENALVYYSKKSVSFQDVYSNYLVDRDSIKYLKYIKVLCKYSANNELYCLFKKKILKEKLDDVFTLRMK